MSRRADLGLNTVPWHVLVHPPGGLVGGDTLELAIRARYGAHGLVTTPAAARFYRSDGEVALQHARITLDAGARIEWLPLETICHRRCLAENRVTLELAPGSEMIGWDVIALGLPGSGMPFERGRLRQHLELPGQWLERGLIDAADSRLLDGPLGLAGHRCLAALYLTPVRTGRAPGASRHWRWRGTGSRPVRWPQVPAPPPAVRA